MSMPDLFDLKQRWSEPPGMDQTALVGPEVNRYRRAKVGRFTRTRGKLNTLTSLEGDLSLQGLHRTKHE